MDQRKRKERFCKKIDQMIMGQNKRSCKNINNTNTTNSIISSTSDNNNNIDIDSNNINSNCSTSDNKIVLKKWIPNQRIEGIRNLKISDY